MDFCLSSSLPPPSNPPHSHSFLIYSLLSIRIIILLLWPGRYVKLPISACRVSIHRVHFIWFNSSCWARWFVCWDWSVMLNKYPTRQVRTRLRMYLYALLLASFVCPIPNQVRIDLIQCSVCRLFLHTVFRLGTLEIKFL